MHAQPSSGTRCLIIGRTHCQLPYLRCANGEGSGETARMHRLAWAFGVRLCDKYHNLMSWLIVDSSRWYKCCNHRAGQSHRNRVSFVSRWPKTHHSYLLNTLYLVDACVLVNWMSPLEPLHDKTNKITCAPSEDSDHLGHPHSVIRSSLFAKWVAKDPSFLLADSEDSDQTERMPRLIWVFAGRTGHFVGFVMLWLIFKGCLVYFLIFSSPELKAYKVSLKYSKALSSVVVVHTFEQLYLQNQLANFSQIFISSIFGVGERLHLVFGADQIKTVVTMATESSHWHIMGKTCPPIFSVIFNQFFVKLADNEDRHKISDELNLSRVEFCTMELLAFERSHWLWIGKMVSPSFLSYYEFSLHQT